jgi:hypothetical protein
MALPGFGDNAFELVGAELLVPVLPVLANEGVDGAQEILDRLVRTAREAARVCSPSC